MKNQGQTKVSYSPLMQSYFLYSALLALKLLALVPIASVAKCPDTVRRANLSDLKHLTPFWLVAALYMTTSPDLFLATSLLRVYLAARLISAISYMVELPKCVQENAFIASFVITCYMGSSVVLYYRSAL